MGRLIDLLRRHRQVLLYLFFGGCTTLINMACYFVLYELLGVSNLVSTAAAWLASVVFAFLTNRVWVFESRASGAAALARELASFLSCRLATGVMDVLIMLAAVDWMHWNGVLWKAISNVLVVLLNYVASKYWIFRAPQQGRKGED